MNSKFIIECPGCKIRFFVKKDLLLEADGLLRCGFCNILFNGNEHIVYKTLDISKEEKAVNSSASQPNSAVKTMSLDGNIQSTALKQPTVNTELKTAAQVETNWDEVANSLSSFSIDFKLAGSKPTNNAEKSSENIVKPDEPTITPCVIEKESTLESEQHIKVDHDILAALENTDFDTLLQLDEQTLLQHQANTVVAQMAAPSFKHADLPDNQDEPIENNIPMDIHGNVLKKVSCLDFMPYEVEEKKVKSHWILWSFLCFLALFVLAAQYIRFVAPMTTSLGAEREWAVNACQYLFCEVPPVTDVNKIITNQLVVRANQAYANILDVDAVIMNQLDIPQPFPIIELRFTDLNGQSVASRRFFPKDYLNAEILAKNLMPSNVPVYITLTIIDPGETAVGYTFNFYEAN